MSYRLVLLLLLLSLLVLVYSKTLVKRANDLENRDEVNGDNTRIDSVKRDIQPQGMQRIEFCFKNPRHRWCIVDRPTMRVEIIRD